VFHPVSYLVGCLPELSNNNNQLSTTCALLCHDCFNVLTNIDLVASILARDALLSRTAVFNPFCSIAPLQELCFKIAPPLMILVLAQILLYFENISMLMK